MLWPSLLRGRVDVVVAAIAVAGAVALFRFKTGVMPMLGTCATAGTLLSLLPPLR